MILGHIYYSSSWLYTLGRVSVYQRTLAAAPYSGHSRRSPNMLSVSPSCISM
jgi:hypothetical protein